MVYRFFNRIRIKSYNSSFSNSQSFSNDLYYKTCSCGDDGNTASEEGGGIDATGDITVPVDIVDPQEDIYVDTFTEDVEAPLDIDIPEDGAGEDTISDTWVSEDTVEDAGIPSEDTVVDAGSEDIQEDISVDAGEPPTDTDDDGVPDAVDNCPDVMNPGQEDCDNDNIGDVCDENSDGDTIPSDVDLCPCDDDEHQTDTDGDNLGDACDPDDDNDGVPDDVDAFPLDDSETADADGDGIGNEADEDDDNDGLSDQEEMVYGEDCSITNPLNPDSDNDGASDLVEAYPNDPFPPFVTQENVEGSVTLIAGDGAGGFGDPFTVGEDLGGICAEEDTNCGGGCPAGQYCSKGACAVEDPADCLAPCTGTDFCRQRMYRWISIADFDADGKMDFLANTYPPEEDGTYQLWFFNRLNETGDYPQLYLGQVDAPIYGTTADVNGDHFFDIVVFQVDKPNYVADVTADTYLGNGIDPDAMCPVGDAVDGCAFTKVSDTLNVTNLVSNQWGMPRARESQDLNGDTHNDLVLGTYASGGNSPTNVYLIPGNGDGTFGAGVDLFTHNLGGSGQGPANSMVFADFDSNQIGDVLMGFDDDGDAGSGWFYPGQASGTFSGTSSKEIDINPACNAGCSDQVGRTGNAKAFDVNFDGAMDVLVGYYYQTVTGPPSRLVVFYGNGDGTFQDALQIGPDWPGKEAMYFQAPQRLCPWYVP